MKLILQAVKNAAITADGQDRGRIDQGLLVLVGIHKDDTPATVRTMAEKLLKLRILCDDKGKMNLACTDPRMENDLAVVSNFTLYADCTKSRRPDFLQSASFEKARELYEMFTGYLTVLAQEMQKSQNTRVPRLITGVFGADMQIAMVADGPITVTLDSPAPEKSQ